METMQHSTEYSEEYVKADELSYNLLWLPWIGQLHY